MFNRNKNVDIKLLRKLSNGKLDVSTKVATDHAFYKLYPELTEEYEIDNLYWCLIQFARGDSAWCNYTKIPIDAFKERLNEIRNLYSQYKEQVDFISDGYVYGYLHSEWRGGAFKIEADFHNKKLAEDEKIEKDSRYQARILLDEQGYGYETIKKDHPDEIIYNSRKGFRFICRRTSAIKFVDGRPKNSVQFKLLFTNYEIFKDPDKRFTLGDRKEVTKAFEDIIYNYYELGTDIEFIFHDENTLRLFKSWEA